MIQCGVEILKLPTKQMQILLFVQGRHSHVELRPFEDCPNPTFPRRGRGPSGVCVRSKLPIARSVAFQTISSSRFSSMRKPSSILKAAIFPITKLFPKHLTVSRSGRRLPYGKLEDIAS